MTEGGDEFGYKDPDIDNRLDHDDDDDGEQEVDTTHPFQPGAASTPHQPGDPYHGGEQTEIRTMQHEQSGLPDTSYAETSFFGEDTPLIETDSERKSILDRLKAVFPKFSTEKFAVMKGTTGKNEGKIVAVGKKGGEYKIMKDDWTGFTKKFLDSFRDELGPSAADIIAEENASLRDDSEKIKEAQRLLNLQTEKEERQAQIVRTDKEKPNKSASNISLFKKSK